MVQAGDIVTCIVTTQTHGLSSADQTVQEVSSYLAAQGYSVLRATTQQGILNTIEAAGYGVSFQATLLVLSPAAFAQPTDLLSIVQNAFYTVIGVYPTAASPPTVQTPGAAPTPTGLPGADPNAIGGAGNDSSVSDAFTNFLNQIKALGQGALVLIVVAFIGLIFVVGYSPNTKHIAGALA